MNLENRFMPCLHVKEEGEITTTTTTPIFKNNSSFCTVVYVVTVISRSRIELIDLSFAIDFLSTFKFREVCP